MAENSKIEWTDHTVNFVIGCEKVSEACANCYAEALDKRYQWGGGTHWGKNAPRYERAAALQDCLRLNRKAFEAKRIDKVFINSLSDTFEDRKDLDTPRAALFAAVTMCQRLRFQLLTKRPENVLRMVPEQWLSEWPSNAWIGTTTENQRWADERIPELLKIPAKVRFLSVEPMFEAIDLRLKERNYEAMTNGPWSPWISWVIVGGESGPKKRPFDCDWARSIHAQCEEAGTAFFMKQIDKVQPIPPDLMIREFPV